MQVRFISVTGRPQHEVFNEFLKVITIDKAACELRF